jgi:hypothetical protein
MASDLLRRAETGNALVTLHGLSSKPELNGKLVQLVANTVAPRTPSAGRIAVRLADESIISVSAKNALAGGVTVGTRVSVGGDVRFLKRGDGWKVEQEYGAVTEVLDNGGCVVQIDSAVGMSPVPRMATLSFGNDSYLLEEDAKRVASLVDAASGWDCHATLAHDAKASTKLRTAALAKLRIAADAAARWLVLENHASMRCLAALTQLQLLRHLAEGYTELIPCVDEPAESTPADGSSAESTSADSMSSAESTSAENAPEAALTGSDCIESAQRVLAQVAALTARSELWASFPSDLLGALYREHCLVSLARPALLLQHTAARSPSDGYESLMGSLFTASQYADLATDAPCRFRTLRAMVACLTAFHCAHDVEPIGWPSPCWPKPEGDAPRVARMAPRAAALSLQAELERALKELIALAAGTDALECLPVREHASTAGVAPDEWARHRASLTDASAVLRGWLEAETSDAVDVCDVCE